MKVLDTFKESLTPEQYASIEESIQELINEKAKIIAECAIAEEKNRLEELAEEFCEKEVAERVALEKTKLDEEYVQKVNEFKKVATDELQTLADKYVEEQIKEAVEQKEAALEEKFQERVEKLEESVLENLDKFLELEITSKIDNSLLESVAKYKAHEPIIEGILSLFENNLVALPQDGAKQIQEAEVKVKEFETKLNESISEKIQLQSKVDKLKTGLLIASKCDSLTGKQKSRVISMFEGKSFDEVNSKIDTFIEVLNENDDFVVDNNSSNLNEDIFADLNFDDDDETDSKKLNEDNEFEQTDAMDNLSEKISRLM